MSTAQAGTVTAPLAVPLVNHDASYPVRPYQRSTVAIRLQEHEHADVRSLLHVRFLGGTSSV